MSVVGPRPAPINALAGNRLYAEVAGEERWQQRHQCKPGITGWAQVNGLRGETGTEQVFEKRLELDLEYLRLYAKCNILIDLWIIILTPLSCLKGENAY